MRGRVALAAVLATLAVAPAASAQGPVVQAVDGTPADGFNNRWSPRDVAINPGETVTWSFDGTTGFHNVQSRSANWSFRNGNADRGLPPASYTFSTPGTYEFVCEVHATTMVGTVTVGNPPPPPPPPPSEQHWENDQPPPSYLERMDRSRPRLRRVRVKAVRNGVRARFRLSERARVVLRLERGRRKVLVVRRSFRPGAHRLTVRDRSLRGRYRVEILARDRAGNRSRIKRARVTIR